MGKKLIIIRQMVVSQKVSQFIKSHPLATEFQKPVFKMFWWLTIFWIIDIETWDFSVDSTRRWLSNEYVCLWADDIWFLGLRPLLAGLFRKIQVFSIFNTKLIYDAYVIEMSTVCFEWGCLKNYSLFHTHINSIKYSMNHCSLSHSHPHSPWHVN